MFRAPITVLALTVLLWAPGALAFGPDPTTQAVSFRFVVLSDVHLSVGDLGVSRAQLHAAVDEINDFGSQIDFVLVTGDLGSATGAADLQTELQAAQEELNRLAVPYHVTIGNHDVTSTGDDSAWRTRFGRANYRFTHSGVQFVSLRTAVTQSSSAIPTASLDSLTQLLSQIQPTDPLVVFAHHPLGPVSPLGASNASEFWARADAYNLKAVLNGHWHGAFEEQRNNAWYCTSGALSVHRANHDDTLEKGYRLVAMLQDNSVASRFYPLGQPPSFGAEPPAIFATGNRYAKPGRNLQLLIGATEPDGNVITYSASGLPPGAGFVASQRLFSWTPTQAQVGLRRDIRFFASDANGTDTLAVAVRVLGDGCLFEDFETQQATWYPVGGSWSTSGGEMRQFNASSGSYYSTTADAWTDVHFEMDFQEESGVGYAGTVFRYQDPSNNYYLWNNGAEIQLRRRVAGVVSRLGPAIPVGSITGWHHVRIEAVGSNFKVYWDGTLRLEATDSTFPSGRIGLVCAQASARFDNVIATGCAGLPNAAPVLQSIGDRTLYVGVPASIVLSATDADGAPIPLAFSARDLPAGATFEPTTRTFNWTPPAAAAGTWKRVNFSVTDGELDDAETVRLCVLDVANACVSETFAGPVPDWTASGATWSVATGEYVGTATTAATSIRNGVALENFTIQTRLRAQGTGTASVLFRVADATHYDALELNASTNVTTLRKVNGASNVVLATGAEVSEGLSNYWHLCRIEVQNSRIRVWLDGILIYDVTDSGGPGNPISVAGRIGFRVQNATLRVDDIYATDCAGLTTDVVDGLPGPLLDGLVASPNPFNPRTTLRFDLGAGAFTCVTIYDIAGRAVRTLHAGDLPSGAHAMPWNGQDDAGHSVASGIYVAGVAAHGRTATQKLVLLK